MNQNQPAATIETTTKPTDTQQRAQQPPTFTAEQQRHVQHLVDKAMAKLGRKHTAELARLSAERDAMASGQITPSDELARVSAERDQARQQIEDMKRQKAEAVAQAAFRKEWRQAGLSEEGSGQKDFSQFVKVNEDGEAYVIDNQGRERIGVTIEQFVAERKERYPGLALADGVIPGDDPRGSSKPKSKADFPSFREKAAYIERHGLAKWEKLPATSPTPAAERDALDWPMAERNEYVLKHGGPALSEKLAEARAARKKSYFRG